MPSFDVVSKTDLMEIDNVINGTMRETKQRFDLAGSKCEITRLDNTLTMIADDTMKLTQLTELLRKSKNLGWATRRDLGYQPSNQARVTTNSRVDPRERMRRVETCQQQITYRP